MGIFPLMVLAKDGKRPEVVEDIILHVEASDNASAHELLALTYLLASMVFEDATDRHWLKRRFSVLHDALRDAWAYQEIMQEGWDEGNKEGLQQGRQEELQKELQAQRLTLLEIVQHRFPTVESLAQKTVEEISDTAALRRLIVTISIAQTEHSARQALLAIEHNEQ